MIGIYKITSNDTGKCYIGQSIDIETRWMQHITAAKYETDNNKFYNALRKYGYENFTYEIIEECEKAQEALDERERYWIEYYDSYNNGYNSTKGGQNKAWIIDPELIRKMWDDGYSTGEIHTVLNCSASLVQRRLQGYKDFNTYTSHQRSSKQYQKIRSFTEKQAQYFKSGIKIHQYGLDGQYIASYPSLTAAATALGYTYAGAECNISRAVHGKENQRIAYNYQWSLDKVESLPPTYVHGGKLVQCLETGQIFSSSREAANWCHLKSSSPIKDYCRGANNYKSAGKHPETGEKLHWRYLDINAENA